MTEASPYNAPSPEELASGGISPLEPWEQKDEVQKTMLIFK